MSNIRESPKYPRCADALHHATSHDDVMSMAGTLPLRRRNPLARFRPGLVRAILAGGLLCLVPGCRSQPPDQPAPPQPPSSDGSEVIQRFLALDRGRDSVTKMRVKILDSGPATQLGAPDEVEIALYSKLTAAGGRLMLVEFISPAQERDRDSLITISPQGEAEGLRYVQSNDSFLTTKGVTSEDALFGMTIQEIADGQPEKYTFRLSGEETTGKWQTYKLEGSLKPDAESKFPRVVLFIAKDSDTPVVAEFYDNHNELLRRITVEDLAQVAGHWTRMRWTLENPARGKRLEFQTLDARYDQGLSDSIFTRENLKKLARK